MYIFRINEKVCEPNLCTSVSNIDTLTATNGESNWLMYVDFDSSDIEYVFVVHLDASIDSAALSALSTRYPSASFKSGTVPINYVEFIFTVSSEFPEEMEYLLSHPYVISLEKYGNEEFVSSYIDGSFITESPKDVLRNTARK
eukprot:Awhi_evm1s10166